MPQTKVLFYCEGDQSAPVVQWLDALHRSDRRAYNKCREAIARLAALGHELRRPTADLLEDGVYELRARVGSVNYRLLYFLSRPKRGGPRSRFDQRTGDSKRGSRLGDRA